MSVIVFRITPGIYVSIFLSTQLTRPRNAHVGPCLVSLLLSLDAATIAGGGEGRPNGYLTNIYIAHPAWHFVQELYSHPNASLGQFRLYQASR